MTVTESVSTQEPRSGEAQHFDVLVVGAGVSGIDAAYHLREKFPDRSFVVLEAQDNRGGTWWTHRYPGVRSDSDLFTYGYSFKPWRGPSIAAGEEILNYLDEVIEENDLRKYIRYHHRVSAVSCSSASSSRATRNCEVSSSVAASLFATPSAVILAWIDRRSVGCGTRSTSPSRARMCMTPSASAASVPMRICRCRSA